MPDILPGEGLATVGEPALLYAPMKYSGLADISSVRTVLVIVAVLPPTGVTSQEMLVPV